jgi:hypothetical protein
MQELARHPFRFSVRSLMIAVVVCALLLTPIAWHLRQIALVQAQLTQASVNRKRAIALAEQARSEYLARINAAGSTSGTMQGVGALDPRAERALWAALAVKHAVFDPGETRDMTIEFTLINDGDTVLDPQIGKSRIIINGKELPDSGLILGSGPRDAVFRALPPGARLQFGSALGKHFGEPGVYRVSWLGEDFRSPDVVFRVLREKAPRPKAPRPIDREVKIGRSAELELAPPDKAGRPGVDPAGAGEQREEKHAVEQRVDGIDRK